VPQAGKWCKGAKLPDMTALTFNTLKYANTLKAAGFTPEQAEAQASALSDVLEVNLKELATKGDLLDLGRLMKADLRELERITKADMRELELRMTITFGAMMVVALGVIAALVKL
jgi:hypothetical protein